MLCSICSSRAHRASTCPQRPRKACPPRRAKRIANRLAKRGLAFKRWEQGDPQAVTMRAVLTETANGLGRVFTYPRIFVAEMGGRAIADAILDDFQRGYGRSPQVASALG